MQAATGKGNNEKNKKIFLCPFNVKLIITMHREKNWKKYAHEITKKHIIIRKY